MNDISVRNARLEDLPVLLQFEQGIIKAERPFDSTLDEDPIRYYDLKDLVLSDTAAVVVAVCDSKIIGSGYAISKKAKPYLNHEYYAYLGFMYTDSNYRGLGVNAKIIDTLKEWSLSNGLTEIRLTVYEDNIPAIRAYEKVGFEKHMIEMRLK